MSTKPIKKSKKGKRPRQVISATITRLEKKLAKQEVLLGQNKNSMDGMETVIGEERAKIERLEKTAIEQTKTVDREQAVSQEERKLRQEITEHKEKVIEGLDRKLEISLQNIETFKSVNAGLQDTIGRWKKYVQQTDDAVRDIHGSSGLARVALIVREEQGEEVV